MIKLASDDASALAVPGANRNLTAAMSASPFGRWPSCACSCCRSCSPATTSSPTPPSERATSTWCSRSCVRTPPRPVRQLAAQRPGGPGRGTAGGRPPGRRRTDLRVGRGLLAAPRRLPRASARRRAPARPQTHRGRLSALTGLIYLLVALVHPATHGTKRLDVTLAQGLYVVWFGTRCRRPVDAAQPSRTTDSRTRRREGPACRTGC